MCERDKRERVQQRLVFPNLKISYLGKKWINTDASDTEETQ